MFEIEIENENKEMIALTKSKAYTVYQIDGLSPTDAEIKTTPYASFDGEKFNSSRSGKRNLVLYIAINEDVERKRINLYRYIQTKKYIKVRYQNGIRDAYVEGYVETVQVAFFDEKETVQVSIICPDSYFKNIAELIVDFTSVIEEFEFPFSIEKEGVELSILQKEVSKSVVNIGDAESGMIITFNATGVVQTPKIYNVDKSEYFIVDITMQEGDEIVINTNKGEKEVMLYSQGNKKNVINDMVRGSSWLTLKEGDNLFIYEAEKYIENLKCRIVHRDKYKGV